MKPPWYRGRTWAGPLIGRPSAACEPEAPAPGPRNFAAPCAVFASAPPLRTCASARVAGLWGDRANPRCAGLWRWSVECAEEWRATRPELRPWNDADF